MGKTVTANRPRAPEHSLTSRAPSQIPSAPARTATRSSPRSAGELVERLRLKRRSPRGGKGRPASGVRQAAIDSV